MAGEDKTVIDLAKYSSNYAFRLLLQCNRARIVHPSCYPQAPLAYLARRIRRSMSLGFRRTSYSPKRRWNYQDRIRNRSNRAELLKINHQLGVSSIIPTTNPWSSNPPL